MAMTDSDNTRTSKQPRDYAEYDVGRTRKVMEPERKEYRATGANGPAARDITRRDVAQERADRFYENELPELFGEALMGEESDWGLPASFGAGLVPGGALAEKLSQGKRPGLVDMPGPSELKAMILLGVPTADILRQAAKHYLKGNTVAADEFAHRMSSLPEGVQDIYALTTANRYGRTGVPTATVPSMGIGSDIKGNNGYYRAKFTAGEPTTNARVMNVNTGIGMSDADLARQMQIQLGKATSADLGKFSNPSRLRRWGMEDEGELGQQAGKLVGTTNKKLFGKLSNVDDPDAVTFIETMSQNPELFSLYKGIQGAKDQQGKIDALMEASDDIRNLYSEAAAKGWISKAYPKEIVSAVEDIGGNRISPDDLSVLLAGGSKFGGLDENIGKMFQPRWVKDDELAGETFARLMANYSDRAGVPLLNPSILKMTETLQKASPKDLRRPGSSVTKAIDFRGIGKPDWSLRF